MDRPLRVYLWLAFGITWGAGGLALLTGGIWSGAAHPLRPLHYLAAFGPSIAGFIMAATTEGWAGVRQLLARALPTWAGVPWYAEHSDDRAAPSDRGRPAAHDSGSPDGELLWDDRGPVQRRGERGSSVGRAGPGGWVAAAQGPEGRWGAVR
jgi:hypothetical protein